LEIIFGRRKTRQSSESWASVGSGKLIGAFRMPSMHR